MTGSEDRRVPRGSCVEEATRASASRRSSKMSSVAPAGTFSEPADAALAAFSFSRLCNHQTTAKTISASKRKMHSRTNQRFAPCKFSQRAPNHANMAAKTSPIPPAMFCQESCINLLPSQKCCERMNVGSVAAQQHLEQKKTQQGKDNACQGPNCQAPDPRICFRRSNRAFWNGPPRRESRQRAANSADLIRNR